MTTPADQVEDLVDALAPTWAEKVASARKALTAFAGLLAQIISFNVLTGTVQHVAQVTLAALTAVGVYAARNVEPDEADWKVADKPPPSPRPHGADPDGDHVPEHAHD